MNRTFGYFVAALIASVVSVPALAAIIGLLGGSSATVALQITTASLPNATVGTAYSQTLSATGGSGSGYTWNLVSVTPNDQLWNYITPSGVVSGTPDNAETESATYQVTDSAGNTAQKTFTFSSSTSGTLTVTNSTSLSGCTSGGYCSYQLIITGGVPPYSCTAIYSQPWQVTPDCWIEGTPTATGSVAIGTITVSDSENTTTTYAPTVTVGSTLTLAGIDPGNNVIRLPSAVAGNYYQVQLNAYGGSGTGFTYSATSLPSWATLSTGGLLSGTPTVSGAFSVSLKVTDSSSNTATATGILDVSSSGIVSRPSYNSSSANGFFVLNGHIYDPTGHPIIFNGMDRNHFDSTTWTGDLSGALTGMNAVREFVGWNQYGESVATVESDIQNQFVANKIFPIITIANVQTTFTGSISGTTLTVSAIDAVSSANSGVIVLGQQWHSGGTCTSPYPTITAQTAGTSGSTGTYTLSNSNCSASSVALAFTAATSGNKDSNAVVAATNLITYALANGLTSSDIAINIANEWGCSAISNCSTTEAQWASYYETAVSSIRTAGFKGPIVIDALDDGEDKACITSGQAANILAADTYENVIISYHVYGAKQFVGQISGITHGTNATITINSSATSNPWGTVYNNGHTKIYITGVQGMTQINGQYVTLTGAGGVQGAWTLTTSLDTSSYGTYTSGGTAYPYGDSYDTYYQLDGQFLANAISNGVAVMAGEFGPAAQNGTTAGLEQFIAAMKAYQVPEVYWAWDDNNQSGGHNLFSGWFGATLNGPGTYALNTPSDLTSQGMTVVLNPRVGTSLTGVPATHFN